MELPENYSPTIIEIFRILYFSEYPQTSGDLQQTLGKRGITIDSRTVRYHLSNLEELNLITKFGKRGALLTDDGIEEAKRLLVFDRIGLASMETEKMMTESNYSPAEGTGRVIVNFILIKKTTLPQVIQELASLSNTSVIASPLIGLVEEGERLWNFHVPKGNMAILCLSSRNYDAVFQRYGIPVETMATGLYKITDKTPRGFMEIISHQGTTLSPGELLIRGKYTSISDYLDTGTGCVTAAIKTFPSFLCERVNEILEYCGKNTLSGPIEKNCVMPPLFRMSVKDRNRGYFIVFGGANYFASLVEKGITKTLRISSCLYDIEKMRMPSDIINNL